MGAGKPGLQPGSAFHCVSSKESLPFSSCLRAFAQVIPFAGVLSPAPSLPHLLDLLSHHSSA